MEHLYVNATFLNRLLISHVLNNRIFKGLIAFIVMAFIQNAYAAEANKSSLVDSLLGKHRATTFLSPEAAFQLNLSAIDAQNIQANFTVAPGYYLYKARIQFEIEPPNTRKIIAINLPAGKVKEDANFGKQEVYHHDFKSNIKLSVTNNHTVLMRASYQGCSEQGLCYAPIKKTLTVDLNASNGSTSQPIASAPVALSTNEADRTTQVLKSGNVWLIIAGFFAAGLLLSLTPCVLPMIPILSSIIVGSQAKQASQQVKPSTLHAFGLSVAYVLGMALSYTLAGIAAGLSGNLLSQSLQNAWVLGATALVFVALAFSMFGFYELKLPQSFEDKLLGASNKLKGGQFFGVFVMGALSALIVSPCVAAPLAGALIYISQTHDALLGGIALFALAIGMGIPLLLIGASAGSLLPKAGHWMNTVRHFFGVLMLGMAVWLISPIIPTSIQLALWSAVFIVTAVYHNALDHLPAHASNAKKLGKGVAVILLMIGAALLIGALSGAKSILQPLSGFHVTSSAKPLSTPSLAFKRVSSLAELENVLAKTAGQPAMLDFYADWCVACKELEQFTFSDPKVQRQLKNTNLLQVDVTANTEADKALLKHFGLFGPPGIAFFNAQGQEMLTLKTVGFQNAERFSATLTKRDNCMMASQTNETKITPC